MHQLCFGRLSAWSLCIKWRDITCKIFGVENNQQIRKNNLIMYIHHYAMSFNVSLEFENKNKEFYSLIELVK